jgi:hypothetical protein
MVEAMELKKNVASMSPSVAPPAYQFLGNLHMSLNVVRGDTDRQTC